MISIDDLVTQGIISTDIADNIRATRKLYNFYKRFVANKYPSKREAPHISKLAEKLTDIRKNKINRLCVAMPPRHSKSSMVTLAFPIWLIIQNPNLKILIVNAEASLSENFGIRLRELIKECGFYFDVYLSDVKHSSTHLMFENHKGELYQGSIRLVGASGSITGQDADYLIIDDPYKGFDDITPTLLNKKIEWFKTMILQRLEPSSKLIILHTRWHTNDLQGYLKENEPKDYDFVEFPAIKEDGSPLWKERYSLDYLKKQSKSMGERLFQSLYQQQPLDLTGEFFDLDNLQYNKKPTGITATVRTYDIAYSKTGDYTVGILAYKDDDNNFYITDMVRGQYGNQNKNIVQRTAEQDGQDTPIGIEFGVGAAAKLIKDEWTTDLHPFTVKEITPIKSKEDRAFPLSNAIIDGKVICNLQGKSRDDFLQEMIAFPDGGHDDIVDAVAHAYNFLFRTQQNTMNAAIIEF